MNEVEIVKHLLMEKELTNYIYIEVGTKNKIMKYLCPVCQEKHDFELMVIGRNKGYYCNGIKVLVTLISREGL